MSKDKGGKPADTGGGGNVVSMNCCVDKCGKRVEKMTFCAEHFGWFKEGLVNRQGQKPSDFDKKYQSYMTKKKGAA